MSEPKLLEPAKSLDDVWKTLSIKPLIDDDLFKAFYRNDVNKVRGGDKVRIMARDLDRRFHGPFFKSFLMGHSGVGKSTEMTRLTHEVAGKYRAIRFSAQADLDAGGFKPFDVLFVMMIKLVEQMAKPKSEGGAGVLPSDKITKEIEAWFATEKVTLAQESHSETTGSAGLEAKLPANPFIGLFAKIQGELKYTAGRKKEVVEYRLNSIATLVSLLNRLISESNDELRKQAGCEWLFIGEDFDKASAPELSETLFLNYSNIFQELNSHFIFNIPIALAYSEKGSLLPFTPECIPDTPVFHPDHTPHVEGRNSVRSVLEARVDPSLFELAEIDQFIVASGGNLRDLFEMVAKAADNAAIAGRTIISSIDREYAVNDTRNMYLRRLGEGPYSSITFDQRVERLLAVYDQAPGASVPAPVLYSLLTARAIQEFNGTRWFGVHPLVVDILKRNGKIKAKRGKQVLGGTN